MSLDFFVPLKITEKNILQFPSADEEGREEFERYIKKAGIWEEVSGISTTRLSKFIKSDDVDQKIKKGIMNFAEEIEKTSVWLVKRKEH